MEKNELIEKLKAERSVVEFYNLKGEILRHLGVPPTEEKKAPEKEAKPKAASKKEVILSQPQ